MKIKTDIPYFGERYCSNNVEYKINYNFLHNQNFYEFYKKGTNIKHNEYGPSTEWQDGTKHYVINNKLHRLCGPAFSICFNKNLINKYYVIGNFIPYNNPSINFIEKLKNILIPKE